MTYFRIDDELGIASYTATMPLDIYKSMARGSDADKERIALGDYYLGNIVKAHIRHILLELSNRGKKVVGTSVADLPDEDIRGKIFKRKFIKINYDSAG